MANKAPAVTKLLIFYYLDSFKKKKKKPDGLHFFRNSSLDRLLCNDFSRKTDPNGPNGATELSVVNHWFNPTSPRVSMCKIDKFKTGFYILVATAAAAIYSRFPMQDLSKLLLLSRIQTRLLSALVIIISPCSLLSHIPQVAFFLSSFPIIPQSLFFSPV